MKILVAGHDRTSDLGAEIGKSAGLRRRGGTPLFVDSTINASCLAKASCEDEYLREFIRLLRHRDAFDTLDFDVPRRPGALGWMTAMFKKTLWKLLYYQYARIAFQQNLINRMFTNALECETALRERDSRQLRDRIDMLERANSKEKSVLEQE